MTDHPLSPTLPERYAAMLRGPSWRHMRVARCWLAGVLALAAVLLAVHGRFAVAHGSPVLVATRDLAPGTTLSAADVQPRLWPADLVPAGALTEIGQAEGQVLAGAANAGETLTGPRLAGPELARRATGMADASSVPIRLADAGVAGLLGPGRLVDVVTLGERSDQPTLLAAGATVLTVLPADDKPGVQGRLVLVAVPRSTAARLAAATLAGEVTVTLR
ncbi:MAG: SAF domain-containing protein [Pseudonocardia sp.]